MRTIEPVVKKIAWDDDDSSHDLGYWLSRPPDERVDAMFLLRDHFFAMTGASNPPRIEKIAIKRPSQ